MAEDFDPIPFEQQMWLDVEALAAAQVAVDQAQKYLLERRDAAHTAISRYGAALELSHVRVKREVVSKLYWGNRQTVQTTPIHQAFSIKGGAAGVASFAGPSPETYPCPTLCGRVVRKSSRTAEPQRCPSCQLTYDSLRSEEIHARQTAPLDDDGHSFEPDAAAPTDRNDRPARSRGA